MKKPRVIGRYQFGRESVEIVADPGTDACFYVIPATGEIPRIRIGMEGEWCEVVSRLLHEGYEMAIDRIMCRYDPTADLGKDHSQYLFVMNHNQLSHVCACVGDLVVNALPDLSAAYAKWHGLDKKSK